MPSSQNRGGGDFRNEIIWCYKSGGASPKRRFSQKHDVILCYGKSGKKTLFNPQLEKSYNRDLKPYKFKGVKEYCDDIGWYTLVGMKDYWLIDMVGRTSKERLGYPTQKPEALLERIIKASSNEGDIILDPFCGCGTTIAVAEKLNRQFVGIDISSFAIDLVRDKRLKNKDINIQGIPFDLRSAEKLAIDNAFNFESWAVTRLPGFVPNAKQIGDGGIDGRATLTNKPDNWDTKLALAQVKSGGKFSLGHLRDFMHVIDSNKAAMGCFVTLHPVDTTGSRKEIANASTVHVDNYDFPRMQMWSIDDYFNQRPPRLPMMNDPYTGKSMIPQLF